jgi:predicted  nucleic acid-binding Zn-ribbon protein
MNGTISKVLPSLIRLSELDSALARLLAKHKQIEKEKEEAQVTAGELQRRYEDVKIELDKKRSRYREEETRIKEENEKLVERRKVLSTFSNYKVQQSAQKEIELSAKQLSNQEEKMLTVLEEVEELEKQLATIQEEKEKSDSDLKELLDSAEGEIESLLERSKEKEAERQEILAEIPSNQVQVYEGIRRRHAVDPLVELKNGRCGGCSMQIAPQMMVQVSRGETLVKCRGCGRVLFLREGES